MRPTLCARWMNFVIGSMTFEAGPRVPPCLKQARKIEGLRLSRRCSGLQVVLWLAGLSKPQSTVVNSPNLKTVEPVQWWDIDKREAIPDMGLDAGQRVRALKQFCNPAPPEGI